MRGEINEFFIIKQIKKPQLCSVLLKSTKGAIEHSRSMEKHSISSLVFLRAFQQNRAQSRLLYLLSVGTCCDMFRAYGHPVAICCDMMGIVGSSLKMARFFTQNLWDVA